MDEYKEYNGEDLTKCCDIHNNTSSNYTICDSGFTSSFTDVMNSDTLKNNTVIVVITDVELSSIKSLQHLEYVTFIGYKNPIVHCRKSGGGGLKLFLATIARLRASRGMDVVVLSVLAFCF